jgi:hypothetical protein
MGRLKRLRIASPVGNWKMYLAHLDSDTLKTFRNPFFF